LTSLSSYRDGSVKELTKNQKKYHEQ
jgi:hypothetical protein